jgi:hypothetical protein
VASFFPPSWWFHAGEIDAGIGAGSGRKFKGDEAFRRKKMKLQDVWNKP